MPSRVWGASWWAGSPGLPSALFFLFSMFGWGGFGGWGISAVDSAGNAIELPPEALEQLMEQVGGGAFGSGQVTAVSGVGEVFMTIATVIMVIGLLTAIAGTILAVILYRKGRKEA